MSDSEDSTVTYTAVSSPFEDGSDIGSPGVDGPPIMPEDPYAYIMAAYQVPPSPDYIPGPEGLMMMRTEDEEEEEEAQLGKLCPTCYIVYDCLDNLSGMSHHITSTWEEVERLLALTTPPPSPLTPLSSPLPHIPSPLFPASPPASPIRPLGYRAAMIRLRAKTPSTSYPLPLPTSSPPLQLLSSDHRTDRLKITLPPQKRLGIDLGPRYEIGESSAAAATRPIRGRRADYGFVDPREAVEEIAPMTLEGVNARVLSLLHPGSRTRRYLCCNRRLLKTGRQIISECCGTLVDDSRTTMKTVRTTRSGLCVSLSRGMGTLPREAWGLSMDASDYARSDVMSLCTTVVTQSALISELQSADHRRQRVISELLASYHKRQVQLTKTLRLMKGLQTQMVEFQRQHGPVKGPAQPDEPGKAGSSS
ncbi:hypothetical protein Tco_1016592 [Tanacetum coccineum]|uniref:Uncharacterized protein n=1 Tax=Tanacetum coccineum TaxID=301880 RepID=A0ABQ5FR09_9ASTR